MQREAESVRSKPDGVDAAPEDEEEEVEEEEEDESAVEEEEVEEPDDAAEVGQGDMKHSSGIVSMSCNAYTRQTAQNKGASNDAQRAKEQQTESAQ